jgi:hypothetical protein
MATSGSVDFNLNRNQIILDAAEEIGIAIDGEALDSSFIGVAERTLNRMVKAWVAHGIQLWKRDSITVTLVADTGTYTLGPTGTVASSTRPLRIIDCDRKDSNNIETSLSPLSLEDYNNLPNKSVTGTPVSYYYSPTLTNGTLKLWPVPSTSVASNYTLDINYHSPIEDFDNSTDEPDFPQEWIEALVYGLARRLARKYGSLSQYEMEDLKSQEEESLELAMSWDREADSIYFQAEM